MLQFCFTASALSLVFATLGYLTAHPLQTACPDRSRAKIVELDDRGNVVRADASSEV